MYFLGLNTKKYNTNLYTTQVMLASVERSCFIKHTDIFTIYGLFINKNLMTQSKKKKKKRLSAISMLSCQVRKNNKPEGKKIGVC